jgi:serine/alanine adding enzyme
MSGLGPPVRRRCKAFNGGEVHLCSLTHPAWDAFVATHPEGTFAHRLGFGRVIADVFGYEPHYLAFSVGHEIRGVLPLFLVPSGLWRRSLVSLPCSDWGGVLTIDGEAEVALLEAARELADEVGAHWIELRSRRPLLAGPTASLEKVNVRLSLTTVEEMWRGLSATTRRNVRQAERRGVRFEVGGPDVLDDFYKVWATNMRDLGTPVYPRSFFTRLLQEFPEDAGVFLVRDNGRAIGGAVFTISHGEMTVPFASSLRSEFGKRPNNLLYWGAIQEACKRGLTWFSFGQSSRGSGTYRFKMGWGAVEEQLYKRLVPTRASGSPPSPTSPAYRIARAIWSYLPLPIANWLGPALAKRFVY